MNAVEPAQTGRVGVPLIAALLLMATHGAVGYQQVTVLLYASVLLTAGLAAWYLVESGFRVESAHLAIVAVTTGLMFGPAVLGVLGLGTKAGVTFLISNVLLFTLFSMALRRHGDQAHGLIARAFLLAAVISAVLAALLLAHPVTIGAITFGREQYFRPMGTFSTPNRFGEATAIGALGAVYLFLRHPLRRLRYGLAGAVLILATAASGSKGVMLGLVAALPFFLLFTGLVRTPGFWRAAVALLPPAVAATYQLWDYLVVAAKLDRILAGTLDAGSGRPEIWAAGWDLFASAPFTRQLFGHGATFFTSEIGRDAHSTYLNLLVDYGLISLFAVFLVVLYLGASIARSSRLSTGRVLAMSLVAFCLVRGLTMPTVFTTFNFAMVGFWAGLAILTMPVTAARPTTHA